MVGDYGTWIPGRHVDLQSPNFNPFGLSLSMGNPDTDSTFMNSGINMIMGNGAFPFFGLAGLPNFNLSQSNLPRAWFYCLPRLSLAFMPIPYFTTMETSAAYLEKDVEVVSYTHSNLPQAWFHCLPRSRQAFTPTPNFKTMETLVESEKDVEDVSSHVNISSDQKKFLVDQSDDKATFIFSSRFINPTQGSTSWSPKSICSNTVGDMPLGQGSIDNKGPSKNELDTFQKVDVQSEMHEDTAEINALLYSDGDCYSIENDDVASTGHSPSMMRKDCDKQELDGGSNEDVPSPFFRNKKRKLFEDDDYDTQVMDTASSLNCNRCVVFENNAESICEGGSYQSSGETSFLLGSKRKKKDRVHGVLSVFQGMIPGGTDKDPIMLLDEAIDCLKSLKVKAKLLGLDSFVFVLYDFVPNKQRKYG